jgi:hypothetical protein
VEAHRQVAQGNADDDRHKSHGVVERFHRQPPDFLSGG